MMEMGYLTRTAATIFMLMLTCFAVLAQPRPGKERITIDLPSTNRWKNQKIPKDTKAIRGTLYTVRGKKANPPVDSIVVTTIDKRYYPMKANGAPEEKWIYMKAACPAAELEILNKKVVSGRTAILYTIKAANGVAAACGSSILLAYIAEGPTALHTIELHIPVAQFSEDVFETWCNILLGAVIS